MCKRASERYEETSNPFIRYCATITKKQEEKRSQMREKKEKRRKVWEYICQTVGAPNKCQHLPFIICFLCAGACACGTRIFGTKWRVHAHSPIYTHTHTPQTKFLHNTGDFGNPYIICASHAHSFRPIPPQYKTIIIYVKSFDFILSYIVYENRFWLRYGNIRANRVRILRALCDSLTTYKCHHHSLPLYICLCMHIHIHI